MSATPKLFTCPKCRHTYLGHDPLPDCPRCGYDYVEQEGFRWDVLVYLLSILSLASFLLVASHYRGNLGARLDADAQSPPASQQGRQNAPDSEAARSMPFESPYHQAGR